MKQRTHEHSRRSGLGCEKKSSERPWFPAEAPRRGVEKMSSFLELLGVLCAFDGRFSSHTPPAARASALRLRPRTSTPQGIQGGVASDADALRDRLGDVLLGKLHGVAEAAAEGEVSGNRGRIGTAGAVGIGVGEAGM